MKRLLCVIGIHLWGEHWIPVGIPNAKPVSKCARCNKLSS